MPGIFDIQPPPRKPKPKKNHRLAKKERGGKNNGVYIFVIIILICILFFGIYSNKDAESSNNEDGQEFNQKEIDTLGAVAEKDPTNVNNNIQPAISSSPKPEVSSLQDTNEPTITNNKIEITVLNGGAGSGAAKKAKTELEENGIEIEKIGNAKSNYSRSVIYYTTVNQSLAQKIQETLADYNPKMEIDNDLVDDESIIVVIGQK